MKPITGVSIFALLLAAQQAPSESHAVAAQRLIAAPLNDAAP